MLLLLSSTYAFSQWTSNTSVNTPVAVREGMQTTPTSISDGAGGVIIFYNDYYYDEVSQTYNYSIYAQRLSASGVAQWGANGILLNTTTDYIDKQVVSDGNGGAVLIWSETTVLNDEYSSKLYAQRIGPGGAKLWGNAGIEITATPSRYYPSYLMYDGTGVVFTYENSLSDETKLYAQRISLNGTLEWGNAGVLIPETVGEHYGGAIFKEATGYKIAWNEEYYPNGPSGEEQERIYWQKLNANGTKNGVNVLLYDLIPSGGFDFYVEDAVADGNGGLYMAIVADNNDNEAKLYLQHISNDGTKSFNATNWGIVVDASIGWQYIQPTYSYVQYGVAIESDGNGGVIVGWTDVRSGSNKGLYAQRFNASGVKLWNAADVTVVPGFASQDFYHGHIKRNQDGDFMFMVPKTVAENTMLFVQKITPNGNVLYTSSGVLAAGSNSTSKYGEMVLTNGRTVLVWEEYRSNDNGNDIFAQSILPDGTLPVQLTAFQAMPKTYGVLLSWETQSETNSSHFIVEKSLDGKIFKELAMITGNHTAGSPSRYQFTDNDFSTSAYYRLTQVDNDGVQRQYNELIRYVAFAGTANLAVYPNPARDNLTISGVLAHSDVKITDSFGRSVLAVKAGGTNELQINVSSLPAGVYYFANGKHSGKFLKTK